MQEPGLSPQPRDAMKMTSLSHTTSLGGTSLCTEVPLRLSLLKHESVLPTTLSIRELEQD